jgi:hypothetical protein
MKVIRKFLPCCIVRLTRAGAAERQSIFEDLALINDFFAASLAIRTRPICTQKLFQREDKLNLLDGKQFFRHALIAE